jgi:hypothetical protein
MEAMSLLGLLSEVVATLDLLVKLIPVSNVEKEEAYLRFILTRAER